MGITNYLRPSWDDPPSRESFKLAPDRLGYMGVSKNSGIPKMVGLEWKTR